MNDHTFAILSFGESPFLERCIQSIKNQKLLDQVIICTSTPSPFIQQLAEKYDIQLSIKHDSSGISDDWNFALSQSKTKFVTLAHQDDIYHPDYLSRCSKHFERDFLILFTNYYDCDVEGKSSIGISNRIKSILMLSFLLTDRIKNPILKRGLIEFGNPIGCPGVIYNKSKLQDFEFSSHFTNNLDWYAWFEMTKIQGSFLYLSSRLFEHRIHEDSVTHRSLLGNIKEDEDLKMFSLFWGNKISKMIHHFYKKSYNTYKIK
ncbi:MAG: glycosyltransferase [Candidatus Marinimicrobia bacterium]|nr:glycosyltransferase [Candidatus Neomarinimicrobiota bacterium]